MSLGSAQLQLWVFIQAKPLLLSFSPSSSFGSPPRQSSSRAECTIVSELQKKISGSTKGPICLRPLCDIESFGFTRVRDSRHILLTNNILTDHLRTSISWPRVPSRLRIFQTKITQSFQRKSQSKRRGANHKGNRTGRIRQERYVISIHHMQGY
jgi:hypothetical protein